MNSILGLAFFPIFVIMLVAFKKGMPLKPHYNISYTNCITAGDSAHKKPIKSVITCPKCGHKKEEVVPDDHCLIVYTCSHCKARITPKKGDCCVFCSYGTVKCPTGDLSKD
jgi:hypothetical protein